MSQKDQPTALNLPMADPLPESTRKYFDICQDKLGMVPNVLKAYAFDIDKLNAFTAMYNDLMLADSGLSKLEREMIAVVVSSINRCWYCQVAHGAAAGKSQGVAAARFVAPAAGARGDLFEASRAASERWIRAVAARRAEAFGRAVRRRGGRSRAAARPRSRPPAAP